MSYNIRQSTHDDLARMLALADIGRGIMRENGNMEQWTNGYPSLTDFENDIKQGISYVIEDEEVIIATFAFMTCPEPTYLKIFQGKWLNNEPYHVIHRLASVPDKKGIFDTILQFSDSKTSNLRIDTHRDNTIMRHLLEKNKFSYCGIVYMQNGDERLAYQRTIKQKK